jgi:hypothetical protein
MLALRPHDDRSVSRVGRRQVGPASALVALCALGCAATATPPAADGASLDVRADAGGDGGPADASDDAGSALDGVLVRPLGARTTGPTGRTAAFALDVPAGATAVTLIARGPPDVWLQVAAWDQPGAVDIVPQAWLGTAASAAACLGPCANRVLAQRHVAAFLAPNTPLLPLRAGAHRVELQAFRVGADAEQVAAGVELALDAALTPGRPGPLRLPLDIYLCGAGGVGAAEAPAAEPLQAALVVARGLLAPAAIDLAPLRYHDIAAEHCWLVKGPDAAGDDVARLFEAGAAEGDGVALFIVEQIAVAGGAPGLDLLLGVAGGVPGDPLGRGHDRAGVAVAWGISADQPALLGRVIAHELAHYLGLFHSTEAPGEDGAALADTIPDTAAPEPGNLMHWTVSATTTRLSPQQGRVLRGSAALVAGGGR